ncbi:MAG: hypothetical protein ABI537_10975 [Casimicrobiaceae bacterium]
MNRAIALVIVAIASAACTTAPAPPLPITLTSDIQGAAVVRRPIPDAAEPAERESIPDTSTPLAGVVVPPNTQYVCVVEASGGREQTSIEFSSKVAALCRKHPEMGPCKYERDVCRRSNGRVYAANGVEITKQTEDEYDKKVMRVVFRAN